MHKVTNYQYEVVIKNTKLSINTLKQFELVPITREICRETRRATDPKTDDSCPVWPED